MYLNTPDVRRGCCRTLTWPWPPENWVKLLKARKAPTFCPHCHPQAFCLVLLDTDLWDDGGHVLCIWSSQCSAGCRSLCRVERPLHELNYTPSSPNLRFPMLKTCPSVWLYLEIEPLKRQAECNEVIKVRTWANMVSIFMRRADGRDVQSPRTGCVRTEGVRL